MTTTRDQLVTHIAEELISYLQSGTLNATPITRALSPEGLHIDELEELLELHFVLSTDVQQYVERLPERIRRLRTENRRRTQQRRGEVRGQIDWKRTREQRYATGFDDPTLFVTQATSIEYDIPENRLVKKLLALIAGPLETLADIDQQWQSVTDDTSFAALQELLERNVYLESLPEPDDIALSKREITQVGQARRELYVEGQRLYRLHQDLLAGHWSHPDVAALLTETLVHPAKTARLFELYCLFGLIRRLRSQYVDLQLQPIGIHGPMAAHLESDRQRVEVYYDRGGPLRFFESYPRADALASQGAPEMLQRQAKALEMAEERLSQFVDRGSNQSFFNGRPDMVLVRYEDDIPTAAVIGEFKYTDLEGSFANGLRELHEYLAFANHESFGYLLNSTWEPSMTVRGIICTDGVSTNTASVDEITHLTTADLTKTTTEQ